MADWEERFGGYVERLGDVLGHADRRAPLRAYCTGLLLPGERKSVEPMAARVDPARVGAAHQSLHHFVAKAAWDDAALLEAVRAYALPAMLERGPVRAWIVDDTGLPKKGRLSVGVARQYCGQLGKRENCQVAVTLSVATEHASLPVAYRLYLPEAWADDPARRALAGVPEEVGFATKPAIALDQIGQALADGVPPGVVVTDAGYGNDTDFRDGVTGLGLADSGAKRNGLSEADLDVPAKLREQRLERGEEAEALARRQVVREHDLLQLGVAQRVEVEVPRQVAPQPAVGVLHRPFLPGGVRVAEPGGHRAGAREQAVPGERGVVVEGDRRARPRVEPSEHRHQHRHGLRGGLAGQPGREHEPGLALLEHQHGPGPLADQQVAFPVPGVPALLHLRGPVVDGAPPGDRRARLPGSPPAAAGPPARQQLPELLGLL